MRCAFVCWRPYQVFNALNIISNDIEGTSNNSDLYIQCIPSLEKLYQSIIDIGAFRNVFLFDEENRGDGTNITKAKMAKIYVKKTIDFINPRRAIKRHCSEATNAIDSYDVILSSGWISFNTELMNSNPNARVVMFEDGFLDYMQNVLDELPRFQKVYFNLLNRIFKKGFYSLNVEKLYLYEPDLVTTKKQYPVLQLPKLNKNTYEKLCSVFGFSGQSLYDDHSIVFLDQPIKKPRSDYKVENVLRMLNDSGRKFVYRRHPLQVCNKQYEFEDVDKPMWELVGKDLGDSSILLSAYSTATLTPFLLYGIKPTIVFLYRICLQENDKDYISMDSFTRYLIKNYKGSIRIPSTYQELEAIINQLTYAD